MDRLKSISTLVAAVEAGSLSAAAGRLGTPLATVSRKVSELEAYLKTRLLNRSSRRLTLTDAGRSYVAACKRILEPGGGGRARCVGRIQRSRRADHHRADRLWPSARSARGGGVPQDLSGDQHPDGAA